MSNKFGEVKTKKSFYPADAREIIEKGTIGILISQCPVSKKTKSILENGNVTLYEGVEPKEVEKILETLKEKENIEKEKE